MSLFSLTIEITMPFSIYLPWGEHSTYIISLVSHIRMALAILQALTSFWPYAHSSHLGFIGVEGRWGEGQGEGGTFYLHHQLCFTDWHWNDSCQPTGSYFFLALCSQQPFRVYWGGGRGEGREHFFKCFLWGQWWEKIS